MDTSDRKAMDLLHWAAMHPDSVVGMARSQPRLDFTEDSRDMEAIEKLRDIQNPNLKVWYEPGVDACYYEIAYIAARDANNRLGLMKSQVSLTKELEFSSELDFRPAIIIEFLQQYIKKFPEDEVAAQPMGCGQKAKAKLQAIRGGARSLVLVLIKVAQAMNPLISVFLPRSPEYAIPYAFLKIMLVFIQEIPKDKRITVEECLECSSFQQATDPTESMKLLIARIYVLVLDLLEILIEYTGVASYVKVLVAFKLKGRKDYDFKGGIEKIRKAAGELEKAAQLSLDAKQHELFLLTRGFAAVMPILYNLTRDTNYATRLTLRAQAISSAQSILDVFQPSEEDVYNELELWRHASFRLSPGGHWERNGILDQLYRWSQFDDPVLFCVGPFGSKHSWVAPFSLDLIPMLQSAKLTLTFALCDRPRNSKNADRSAWSPTMLVKRLLGQLLEQEPLIFFRHPEIFNTRSFEKARDFPAVWRLFEQIVVRLDNLFVIIDRVDACTGPDDMKVSLGSDVLRSLVTLARRRQGKLKLVITSAEKPPLVLCEALKLRYAYISTQRPPHRRETELEWDSDSESGDRVLHIVNLTNNHLFRL